MNYKMILHVLGWLLIFESLFMFVPMITAIVYGESALWSFLSIAAICLVVGRFISMKMPENKVLYAREGFVIVSLSWIVLSFFGALPFVLTGAIPSLVDAVFESVSGFTTTGASILSDVEVLPRSVQMWRSFSHWIGGMGVLVFIMAFLPLSGGQNMHIMKAESAGPSVGKLVPRVKTTALILYSIYFALTALEFISLLIAGMPVFDALNATFATAGTGGFGIMNTSIGGYTTAIQIIITVFMVLFSVNFNCYFLLLQGKLKSALNTELRVFLIVYAVSSLLVTLNISGIYNSFGDALNSATFTVASIMSTTGFSIADFNSWPELSRLILTVLMFVGACAGSTCGGIKISRYVILFKGLKKELQLMIHPKQVKKIKLDSHELEHSTVRSVNVYIVCFLLIFFLSVLIVSFDNHDLITNFTAVAATLNNVGPGLELVGPTQNFGFFSDPAKIVLIFDMLAGRLELFPVLLLFMPGTWKK